MIAGAALSFGLGARSAVANLIAAHYLHPLFRVGQTIRVADVHGQIVALTPVAIVLDTPQGRVVVPAGTFRTGAIFLKQGAACHLEEGAVLAASTELSDYPKQMTRSEGHFEPWRPALLNAANLTKVRITGSGTLDGSGYALLGGVPNQNYTVEYGEDARAWECPPDDEPPAGCAGAQTRERGRSH